MKRFWMIWVAMFLMVWSALAQGIYSDVKFYGNVHMATNREAVVIVSAVATNGGTYLGDDRGISYRVCATNYRGRLPVSTNVSLYLDGSPANSAVLLTWEHVGGATGYVVERATNLVFDQWISVSPHQNTLLDTGSNSWQSGTFSNLYTLLPPPIFPWASKEAVSSEVSRVDGEIDVINGWVLGVWADVSAVSDRVDVVDGTLTQHTAGIAAVSSRVDAVESALQGPWYGFAAITNQVQISASGANYPINQWLAISSNGMTVGNEKFVIEHAGTYTMDVRLWADDYAGPSDPYVISVATNGVAMSAGSGLFAAGDARSVSAIYIAQLPAGTEVSINVNAPISDDIIIKAGQFLVTQLR